MRQGHGGRWSSAWVAALQQHPEVQLAEVRLVHPAPVRMGSGAGEFTLMGKAADTPVRKHWEDKN